jgi:DNA-binding MarR family transcriptional regulator
MSKSPPSASDALAHATAEDLRALIGTLRRRLREEARAGDFTPSQIQCCICSSAMARQRLPDSPRALDVRPQSMGETLTVLKAAGAVSGAPDPNDGRQTVLSLTPAFRQKVKASRAAREDWLYRAIQSRFTAAEQQQLATGVELLKRLVAP